METILSSSENFLFITLAAWLAAAGGVLIWVGFAAMAMLSRRYERVFGKPTHWLFLWVAPAGLCAYLVMQTVAALHHENIGPLEQWIGYALLCGSAVLCFWGIWGFRRILTQLAKEG
jgi:hypothetical protein